MTKLKKVLCTSVLVLLLTFSITTSLPIKVSAKPDLSVHNIDTKLDYGTIQEAISAHETLDGHTIFVEEGIYHQHVTIIKSIKLVGESRDTTIIDGDCAGTVVRISANNVSILNFTIRNAGRIWGPPPGTGYPDSCILGSSVRYVHIKNNALTGAAVCVFLVRSSFVNVSDNVVFNATYAGIIGYSSSNIMIHRNLVYDCGLMGIHLDGGSTHSEIVDNTVMNNLEGIELEKGCAGNLIQGNCLNDNNASIVLNRCGIFNIFRKNNMTSNYYSLVVFGFDLDSFMQDIDESNTVNNKTVYYLTNKDQSLIDTSNYPNLGYLAIVNCSDTMIRDFNLTYDCSGVLLAYSTNCTLTNMTLSKNFVGVMFFESENNWIVNNRISNNSIGVGFYSSDKNVFYHNSFLNNEKQVVSDFYSLLNWPTGYSMSIWDNDFEGNYWSDYNGTDRYSGPYQNQTGRDGLGDTPHIIDGNNQDNYPLMGPFSDFNVSWQQETYHVTTISNSTVSDLFCGLIYTFIEEPMKAVFFNVTGEDGTTGFCRVCIPTALMNDTYKVFVNGTEVPHTLLLCSNSTYNYLYFTYNHSTQEVVIIPEFPSALILPLLIIPTLVAVILSKNKRHSTDKQYMALPEG